MKTRTWFCRCCHKSMRRYKNREYNNIPHCLSCEQDMVKGNKFRSWKDCKHTRAKRRISRFKERHYSKVRNIGGRVLKVSKETRQLWKSIKKVKHRDTLLKRSNMWLESLKKDLWNCPEDVYNRSIDSRGEISESRGGMTGIPKIVYKDYSGFTKGQYTRSFVEGKHEIFIVPNGNIGDMKKTLLHEVLHYLDDVLNVPNHYHDCYWNIRLRYLEKMFPILNI